MTEKCIKWSDCVGVSMDAACVMAGNKGGLQILIKRSAAEAMWTHCTIHRESLATKELFPELSEVKDTVIKSVNYIKIHLLKSRLFAKLCEEMGAQYQSILFYCVSHWLSRENVARVYNLQGGVAALFLDEETWYMLHVSTGYIIIVTDKGKTFIGKLGLWVRKLRKTTWKQVTLELISVSEIPSLIYNQVL
jgi:hypothetical protein